MVAETSSTACCSSGINSGWMRWTWSSINPQTKESREWYPDCMVASYAPTAIDRRWPFHKSFWWESWCWGWLCEMSLHLAWTSNLGGWIGSSPLARHAVAASPYTAVRSRSGAYHSHPPSTSPPAFSHQPSCTTPSLQISLSLTLNPLMGVLSAGKLLYKRPTKLNSRH